MKGKPLMREKEGFILSPKLQSQLLLIILCMCVYSSVWPDKFQSQLPLIVLVVILSLDAS